MKGSIVIDDPPLVLGVTGVTFNSSTVRIGSSFSAAFSGSNLTDLTYFGVTFNSSTVRIGSSFSAAFSGSNLTDLTYFDIRFRAPGSTTDQESQNWQRGVSANHAIAAGTATGMWTITGVRPHQQSTDHSGNFVSTSVTLTVSP